MLIFHTFWLVICKLDPYPNPAYQFDSDPDPQHCFVGLHIIHVATASLQQYKKKFHLKPLGNTIMAHRFLYCLVLDFFISTSCLQNWNWCAVYEGGEQIYRRGNCGTHPRRSFHR
jgi:hypothetical protein